MAKLHLEPPQPLLGACDHRPVIVEDQAARRDSMRSCPSQARDLADHARVPAGGRHPRRSRNLLRLCLARGRSALASKRARTRSRSASSSGPGTQTGVRSPLRSRQTGECDGVARVGLDPIPGLPRNQRGRHDLAFDSKLGQLSIEAEAGEAGFIGHPHDPALSQLAHELPDGAGVIGDRAVRRRGLLRVGNGDRDRLLVHIQSDEARADL